MLHATMKVATIVSGLKLMGAAKGSKIQAVWRE